eukprot:7208161-Ditylum_brightwellii.AAC.1
MDTDNDIGKHANNDVRCEEINDVHDDDDDDNDDDDKNEECDGNNKNEGTSYHKKKFKINKY